MTLSNYLATLWPALNGANVLYPSFALPFLVITILGFMATRMSFSHSVGRPAVGLQMAVWGALAAQFLIYPMLADRLFVAHYALITVLTVSLIGSRYDLASWSTARREV